jgi:hypothetical protein
VADVDWVGGLWFSYLGPLHATFGVHQSIKSAGLVGTNNGVENRQAVHLRINHHVDRTSPEPA